MNRLGILNRIARAMNLARDLQANLDEALSIALELFPQRDLGVWLLDAHRSALRCVGWQSTRRAQIAFSVDSVESSEDPLLIKLMQSMESLAWNEDQGLIGSAFIDGLLGEGGYHCLTLVPLIGHGQALGMLLVASSIQQSLCEGGERESAETLAYQLAEAVNAATLLDELRSRNAELEQQRNFLQTVVDVTEALIFAKDLNGRLVLANRAVAEIYGRRATQLLGCMDEDLGVDPQTAGAWRSVNQQVMRSGEIYRHSEQLIVDHAHQQRWFETIISPLRDIHGAVQGVVGSLTDITERHRAHEALSQQRRFLQSVIDVSPASIWVKDLEGHYLLINRAGAAIFGSTPEAMLGRQDQHTYLDEATVQQWQDENREVAESGVPRLIAERMIPGLDGKPCWYRVAIAPFEDHEGQLRGVIVSATEITERVLTQQRLAEANRELERLAQQDGLTSLANRRHLDQVLAREWRRLRRQQASLALVMLDVDHFKSYNDLYGHLQGDDCLRQVATSIAAVLQRPADLAGRFGGEEFLLILPETERDGALAVARNIIRVVADLQIPHTGSPLGHITVSLGVAVMVPGDEDSSQLVLAADRALYRAKNNGRNQVAVASIFS